MAKDKSRKLFWIGVVGAVLYIATFIALRIFQ